MTMSLQEARDIIELQLQIDTGVALFDLPPTAAQLEAARRVEAYHADLDYHSAEGRRWRAQQRKKVAN